MRSFLARFRVPLGFASAAAAFWLAEPTTRTILTGFAIAAPGELLRIWAAGHLEKGREITQSGPYRFVRHPLYLGSTVMGAGFVVAAWSTAAAAVAAAYMGLTLGAAIRTEEAVLDSRFAGAYSQYREGRAASVDRRFSWSRVRANRELRAVLGLAAAFVLLWLKRGG
jgi:protein-S-isoprenylcysteine O-methyltransferase Ste14